MSGSLILRYGDAEEPTIPSHQKIIAEQHSTWWGWWKKRTEPLRLELLRDLEQSAANEEIHVGLVNRKGLDDFYDATCVGVKFAEDGTPIPSPEAGLTPEYYNSMPCPAWFKFTQIRQLQKQEFLRYYGGIPNLDPTLYEVIWEDDRPRLLPEPSWTMEPIETNGDAILHLSDLHFGEDHGFVLDRPPAGRGIEGRPLHEIIANRITRELRIRVGTVVVSGDLITRGDGDAYPHAIAFLDHLLAALGLERKNCVLIPGNHDLWTVDLEHPTRQYAHEGPYRLFLSSFFQMDFQGLERVRRFRTRRGLELIFVELNSARIRSDFLREYGYVAKHRYDELLRFVNGVLSQENPNPNALVFAVLHHHILPVSSVSIPEDKRPVSMCLDAGELIEEFQAHNIRFVLHGHEHAPFIGMTARSYGTGGPNRVLAYESPLYVLGCGSSGAKRDRLPDHPGRNTYSIYIPTRDGFQVTVEQYTSTLSPEPLWKISLPVRA